MLTIVPRPLASIAGIAALHASHVPSAFVSTTRRHESSSSSAAFANSTVAAQFNRTSSAPNCATVPLTISMQLASSRTSTSTASDAPPSARMAAATVSALSGTMSAIATRAPCSANRRAHAAPMPRPAPVISVVLPASRSPISIPPSQPRVDAGGQQDDAAVHDLLVDGVDREQVEPIADQRKQEDADHGPPDSAFATTDARATDDDCGDCIQLEPHADVRLTGRYLGGRQHPGKPGRETADDKGEPADTPDAYARQPCRLLVSA